MTDNNDSERVVHTKDLEDLVSGTDKDLEWAKEKYDEALEKAQSAASVDLSADQLHAYALSMVRAKVNALNRTSGGFPAIETDVIAIGHRGTMMWKDRDNGGKKEVGIAFGLANPEPDNPDEYKLKPAAFILDETDGVDPHAELEKFEPLSVLKGYFNVRTPDEFKGVYTCNSTDETRIEAVPEETLPEGLRTRDERRAYVNDRLPEARLADIHAHLSAVNNDGYTVGFGADIKRMNVTVQDWYIGQTRNGDAFGTYTVLDDSVVGEEDLSRLNITSDRQRTPGFTCFTWNPEDMIEYGDGSVLDVYGAIRTNDEGRISMDLYGVVDVIGFPREERDTGGSGGRDNPDVETEGF